MLARRGEFKHPTAGSFDLPLLVPSFSSKGFGLEPHPEKDHDFTLVAYELQEFSRVENRSVLVSAYDLHFNHFNAPGMEQVSTLPHLCNCGLVFLDSGGYEKADDFDSSEIRRSNYKAKDDYGVDEYKQVLDAITIADSTIPLVIANADWTTRNRSLSDQIQEARRLFDKYSQYATTFIIKPGPGKTVVEPDDLSPSDYKNLKGFDVIGVTEKELGKNLRQRLKRVAALRKHLNDAQIAAPIHLWGGLDPVLTPLFFFAGAEVFDGISWLRYAFCHGVAVNRECGPLLDANFGVNTPADQGRVATSVLNRQALSRLETSLQSWVDYDGKKFDMFGPLIETYLRNAYETMLTWNPDIKGGN